MPHVRWPLFAVVVSLAFAPAPLPRVSRAGPRSDLERLQGTWEVVDSRMSGVEMTHNKGARVEVRRERWTFIDKTDSATRLHWDLRLNPSATPPEIDFEGLEGVASSRGIYRLEGDTLTISYGYVTGGGRPTAFDRDRNGYVVVRRIGR